MAGTMKNQNQCPTVVKNPTPYTGGKNKATCSEVVKNPTRYTGGKNKEACNVPKGRN